MRRKTQAFAFSLPRRSERISCFEEARHVPAPRQTSACAEQVTLLASPADIRFDKAPYWACAKRTTLFFEQVLHPTFQPERLLPHSSPGASEKNACQA